MTSAKATNKWLIWIEEQQYSQSQGYKQVNDKKAEQFLNNVEAETCQSSIRQYTLAWQVVSSLHGVHDHVSMCDTLYHDYVTYTIMSVCVTHCIMITSHTRSCQYVWQIVSWLRHVHDHVSMCDKLYHDYVTYTIMSVCATNRIITSRAWSC